ncbi:Ig-like domain-containing protein [Shewanella sp. GXUN23E]|uniref:Ig-like domain-containing protein n=1 Tax=Shewanella sp. GXUN23E TaxID=3422498 RepID=UPI003D7F14FF
MQRLLGYGAAVLAMVFTASMLSGCNGAADGTDSSGQEVGYGLSISFQTRSNGQCGETTTNQSFNAGDSFCATATLTRGSSPQSGEIINFTTSMGSLSAATALTSADGSASIIISNPAGSQGAGTVSLSFTPQGSDAISAKRNFEFVGEATPPTEVQPTLSASIMSSGQPVTRFKVDEPVQLQAKLTDAQGQAMANQLVSFSAGSATLTPATALTSDAGIAQVSYTPAAAELGAHSMTVSSQISGLTLTASSLYEVIAKDAIGTEGILKLGHFVGDEFIEGKLKTSLAADAQGKILVSAGGAFGVQASLVTQASDGSITKVQTPSSIKFSSDCVLADSATIDSPVTTLSGTAYSTFQDIRCAGNSDREDTIVATAVAGNETLNATLKFTLASQTLSSLKFISADPTSIRIKGSGGTDASESSLITFKVTGSDGQGVTQQEVNFSLDTLVGGISFANGETTDTGLTNAEGLVSVRVLAGTVPTPVRVQASATDSGETIVTQSEQLSINTGLPQQLGMSLSTSNANPEADGIDGQQVTVTARLSDSFGNPVPDDTTVNFTTEGGQIGSSCVTQNGSCSVIWTSQAPRVPDHRITVLAYALGHETFFDTNGNNIFDAADGVGTTLACLNDSGVIIACNGNGLDREAFLSSGFSDLPNAFRDDNETGSWESGEPFFNPDGSNQYAPQDDLFNGPQCQGSLCGTGTANKTYIRKAQVLVMSGSQAFFTLTQDGTEIYNSASGTIATLPIAANATATFAVRLYDSANQLMPSGSALTISTDLGTLGFNGYTVPKGNALGGSTTTFTLKNDGDSGQANISLTLTTPSGQQTLETLLLTLL